MERAPRIWIGPGGGGGRGCGGGRGRVLRFGGCGKTKFGFFGRSAVSAISGVLDRFELVLGRFWPLLRPPPEPFPEVFGCFPNPGRGGPYPFRPAMNRASRDFLRITLSVCFGHFFAKVFNLCGRRRRGEALRAAGLEGRPEGAPFGDGRTNSMFFRKFREHPFPMSTLLSVVEKMPFMPVHAVMMVLA